MLTPDITIMSVGTEITYGNSMVPDDGWETFLNNKWDRKIVTEETSKFPELSLQVHIWVDIRSYVTSVSITKIKLNSIT